jgi:hypothetical protein
VLQSDDLFVRIDLVHGGEIADLVELHGGRQLLAHSPFSTASPVTGDVDESVWLSQYRGGWQLLTPNAGNPCLVGDDYHGYHGAASNEPWTLVDVTRNCLESEWRGHGVTVCRKVQVEGPEVLVDTTWRSEEARVPFLAVEHLALGPELLDPSFELTLPRGRTYELSEVTGPETPPENAPVWPTALLLDGSSERVDRFSFDSSRSRFLAVADLPDGRAEIRNPKARLGFRLEWETTLLANAWIWQEVRCTGGRWRGAGQQLMIEPASLPHSLGLESALRSGHARYAEPGEELTSQVKATVLFL